MNKLFSEMVDGYPNIPTPRPTRTHTYDFGCTFMGVWILDGECKASATEADKGFMVLNCLDQLVIQDVELQTSLSFTDQRKWRSVLRQHFGQQGVIPCDKLRKMTFTKIQIGLKNHFWRRYL